MAGSGQPNKSNATKGSYEPRFRAAPRPRCTRVPQGLDILTPLGRGASLLVIGPAGSGKTQLGLDAVLAQVGEKERKEVRVPRNVY